MNNRIFAANSEADYIEKFIKNTQTKINIILITIMLYPNSAVANRCRYDPESCVPHSESSGVDVFGWIFGFLMLIWVNGGAFVIGFYIAQNVFKSEKGGALLVGVIIGYLISTGSLFFVLQNFSKGEIFFGITVIAGLVFFKLRSGMRH